MKPYDRLYINEFLKGMKYAEIEDKLDSKKKSISLTEYKHIQNGKLIFMLPREAQDCPEWQRV